MSHPLITVNMLGHGLPINNMSKYSREDVKSALQHLNNSFASALDEAIEKGFEGYVMTHMNMTCEQYLRKIMIITCSQSNEQMIDLGDVRLDYSILALKGLMVQLRSFLEAECYKRGDGISLPIGELLISEK